MLDLQASADVTIPRFSKVTIYYTERLMTVTLYRNSGNKRWPAQCHRCQLRENESLRLMQ